MHFPTCGITCVCGVTIYIILMLICLRWGTLLKQYIHVLKAKKLPTFVLLCGIKFYTTPTQPYWSLWVVYSHKLFPALNIKIELPTDKNLFNA